MVRSLLESEIRAYYPDLQEQNLPCGGIRFSLHSTKSVHVLFSPLAKTYSDEAIERMHFIAPALSDIMHSQYIPFLSEMNGANFYYPRIYFSGCRDPRRLNTEDGSAQPGCVHTANSFERDPLLPMSEMVLGALWEPDCVPTLDLSGAVRLRRFGDVSSLMGQFTSLAEFAVSALNPDSGWAKSWKRALN